MAKVLAIDDQKDNLTTIRALLKKRLPEVAVVTAESGMQGIKKAKEELPDVILLDIRMPVMDGWETCKRIKSDPEIRHIPLIMLTAVDTDARNRARGLNIGADAFLAKPIDPTELTAQVMAMLRIKRAEDILREQRDTLDQLVLERTRELREAEAHYRTLFNSIGDGVSIHDLEGRFLEVNAEACRRLGYEPAELLKMTPRDIDTPEHAVHTSARMEQIRTHGQARFESLHLTRNGEELPSEVCARLVEYEGKNAILCVVRDISERKRMEKALEESEVLFRTAFQHAGAGMAVIGKGGRFLKVNLALSVMLGYSEDELLAKTWMDITHPEDLERGIEKSKEILAGARNILLENRFIDKNGLTVWITTSAASIHDSEGKHRYSICLFQNITDRKLAEEAKEKAEKQLHQAQKMEAIGTLAGGIAHDFNNILGIIIGYTEVSLLQIPKDHPTRPHLREVLGASHRATDLVKQILTFSRYGEQERKPIEIAPTVKETLRLLRASLPATIDLRERIGSRTGMVLADPTQIHQVLINLCTNAADAMRDASGVLKVNLNEVEIGPQELAQYPDLACGPHLEISVCDTGHGMDTAVIDRIFDPFFTTKGPGKGTGLGLAVVHGIVKAHGGAITVESEVGKGSTFRVFLPQIKKQVIQEPEELGAIPEGKERILLVDDEGSLVGSWKKMLEILGYKVTGKTNGLEALEVFCHQPNGFDLVITDHTMPHLTGVQLAKEITDVRPDLPVILCTGHSEYVDSRKAAKLGIRQFIMKPLDLRTLSTAIRKVLDSKR